MSTEEFAEKLKVFQRALCEAAEEQLKALRPDADFGSVIVVATCVDDAGHVSEYVIGAGNKVHGEEAYRNALIAVYEQGVSRGFLTPLPDEEDSEPPKPVPPWSVS